MANIKISALPSLTQPHSTDQIPIVDNSGTPTTSQVTWASLFKSPVMVTPTITGVVTESNNSIGAVSTDGLVLQNTTAAAAGAQQWSPRLHLIGQGWKTTATAGSQTVDWIAEVQPVQGAANPTSNLVFSTSVNGGAYAQILTLNTSGATFNAPVNTSLIQTNDIERLIGGGANIYTSAGANAVTIGGTTTPLYLQGIVQFGGVDAASPLAQTVKVQSIATGTSNGAGTLWKFIDSTGTGTGVSGGFEFDVHPASTTGSTQNAAVSALAIDSTKRATFGGQIFMPAATAGGSGNQTVNSPMFTAIFGTGASSLTITNSFIGANSYIFCQVLGADTTMKSVTATISAGSVLLTSNAASTGTVNVQCVVHNQ